MVLVFWQCGGCPRYHIRLQCGSGNRDDPGFCVLRYGPCEFYVDESETSKSTLKRKTWGDEECKQIYMGQEGESVSGESVRDLPFQSRGITHLEPGIFDGMRSVLRIDLGNNTLTSIPADLLSTADSITSFKVNQNSLTSLDVKTFSNNKALQTIDLSDNKLDSLPAGVFDQQGGTLKHLYLNDNLLQSNLVPYTLMEELDQLVEVRFQNNKLSCYPKMQAGTQASGVPECILPTDRVVGLYALFWFCA